MEHGTGVDLMAWVTAIRGDGQVAYWLREDTGCHVQTAPDIEADPAVTYRMHPEGDGVLVWMGQGLETVGLTAGTALDEDGKQAARLLMNGCHPATGARLVGAELRAHPAAKLTGARLLEALGAAAGERGLDDAADLLTGKPKQQAALKTLRRMVHQLGESHRVQVGTLHKLARAAGLDLADVYQPGELAEALAHQNERVSVRVRGWDLTADLDKSSSVVFGLLGPEDSEAFRGLFHQAKREAFSELEEWIGYGVAGDNGELVRIATGGLMGWSVEHQSARPVDDSPGDPHLHAHIVVANVALCEDGEWRSIANSGQDLHRHAKAFDALFKARVRALAYERFGIRYEQDERTRAWEVVGIPQEVRAAFSRRGAAVDELAGADASREDKHRAAAETRHEKHEGQDVVGVRASWRSRAAELVDVEAMMAAAVPGPPPDGGPGIGGPGDNGPKIPPPDQLATVVFDPQHGLTAHDKAFSRAQLLAALAHALPQGIGAELGSLDQLADQVLAVDGYAVRLPDQGSRVMTSTERYTTADILAAERVLVEQATARYGDGSAQLTADQAAAAVSVFEVAAGFELSVEQRSVVERVLTAGHGVDAVVGVAGSGKTTLMEACRLAWDATGTTYAGAALAAVAAANLQAGSGIPSRTLAAWAQRIESGTGLDGIDVLVVDEGAMADDRQLAAVLIEAARTGTKVLAIGDPKQLQAIGPGGGFAEVHRIVGGAVLTENRRQVDAGERAALEMWRTDARQEALQMLAAAGRVHAAASADDARTQVLAAWDAARRRWADPHDVVAELVVLAARNADVNALNSGAQTIRRAAGELGAEHTYALPGGDRLTLAVGDVVRVRENDYRSRRGGGPDLLNGYRAVVDGLDAQQRVHITWRTAAGTQDGAWVDRDQVAGGALSLGYAMTIAASQGLTATTALTYGHGADAYALYPGITRAREANHLWLPVDVLEDEATRARLGDARSEAEQLQRAVAAYGKLLQQDRPDAMVSDQLRPAPEPAAAVEPRVLQEVAAPAVQPWRERQYGHLRGDLQAAAVKAEVKAAVQRAAAEEAERKAAALAAVLGTEQQPARLRTAENTARLDLAEQHLARAEDLTRQSKDIEARVKEMYAANHAELREASSLGARAALKRSAVLGTRWSLQRQADDLRRSVDTRTAQIATLHEHRDQLRAEAGGLQTQARELIAQGRRYASYKPLEIQLTDRRADVVLQADQMNDRDHMQHRRWVQEADSARTKAGALTERAAGLRSEAAVRRSLTPEQANAENGGRALAAQKAAAHARQVAAEHAQEQRERRERDYRYEPPSQDRSGPSLGL